MSFTFSPTFFIDRPVLSDKQLDWQTDHKHTPVAMANLLSDNKAIVSERKRPFEWDYQPFMNINANMILLLPVGALLFLLENVTFRLLNLPYLNNNRKESFPHIKNII